MEEILSVMREIQELSTEHKTLNSVDTTEKTISSNVDDVIEDTAEESTPKTDSSQIIDSQEFNQMLGAYQRG